MILWSLSTGGFSHWLEHQTCAFSRSNCVNLPPTNYQREKIKFVTPSGHGECCFFDRYWWNIHCKSKTSCHIFYSLFYKSWKQWPAKLNPGLKSKVIGYWWRLLASSFRNACGDKVFSFSSCLKIFNDVDKVEKTYVRAQTFFSDSLKIAPAIIRRMLALWATRWIFKLTVFFASAK